MLFLDDHASYDDANQEEDQSLRQVLDERPHRVNSMLAMPPDLRLPEGRPEQSKRNDSQNPTRMEERKFRYVK